jgi:patatin-like phospholipase/acyl hydrolase
MRLEQEHANFLRDVDLLAGTSTGGIIALALAAETPLPQIKDFYTEKTKIVFKDSFWDNVRDVGKLRGADYSTDGLRTLLREYFGDMKLRDLNKKVAITAFDLDNESTDPRRRAWKPKIFHNFDGVDSDGDLDVVDVGLYTSAAPTYFPTVDGYIDGGVVANNPALVGIIQAIDRRGGCRCLTDLSVLSIGTGKNRRYVKGDNLDWGFSQWATRLLPILFEGAIDMVTFECNQLLGGNFHRLEPVFDKKFELDKWKAVPELVRLSEEEDISATVEWLRENWK